MRVKLKVWWDCEDEEDDPIRGQFALQGMPLGMMIAYALEAIGPPGIAAILAEAVFSASVDGEAEPNEVHSAFKEAAIRVLEFWEEYDKKRDGERKSH